MAGNHGADYVEFDVHLTRDLVPVVYHNFLVATTLAREGFFSGELYAMEVKELTLHQLQSLKLDHSSALQKKLGMCTTLQTTFKHIFVHLVTRI